MYPYDNINKLYIASKEHYEWAGKIVKGSVLDVGCGYGALIPYLTDVEYTGIDATQWAVDKANDSRVTFCDIFDYDGYFDYVCAFGVLETAKDLKVMAEKLKSLGNVVLSSFMEGEYREEGNFKYYPKQMIIDAFGDIEFYKPKCHETYFMWSKHEKEKS